MPKEKDNRITVKMKIKEFVLKIRAEGNIAMKATVLIILIVGFVIALIEAPQHRNDIVYFFCLLVALATFFISYIIYLQTISES